MAAQMPNNNNDNTSSNAPGNNQNDNAPTPPTPSPETKQEAENAETKALSEHWTLRHGNLESVFSNVNSADYVLFERIHGHPIKMGTMGTDSTDSDNEASTEQQPELNPTNAATETKSTKEQDQLSLKYILVRRVQKSEVISHVPQSLSFTDSKPVSVVFLFAKNNKLEATPRPSSYKLLEIDQVYPGQLDPAEDVLREHFSNGELFPLNDFSEQNRTVSQMIWGPGGYEVTRYFAFTVEEMLPSSIEILVNMLKKLELIHESDLAFLIRIMKPRSLSQAEKKAKQEYEQALQKQDSGLALEKVKLIHQLSREAAMLRGAQQWTQVQKRNCSIWVDDCDAAINFGNLLEKVDPKLAVEAFQIVADYEYPEDESLQFESPYVSLALSKIVDLGIVAVEQEKDLSRKRKLREKTINAAFTGIANEDEEEGLQAFQLAFKLLETQAGFSTLGETDRLFKITMLNKGISGKQGLQVLTGAMTTMANKLYDYREKLKAAGISLEKDTQTASSDVKDKAENAATTTHSPGSAPGQGTPAQPKKEVKPVTFLRDRQAATAAPGASGTAAVPAKKTRIVKSLEDSDSDEDSSFDKKDKPKKS